MAHRHSDPTMNYAHMRFSQPNQAIWTPDLSYPLVSSTSFLSSSPISLFLVCNSIIILEHKVNSSIPLSPCHDYESILNTTYTQYNIHWVQHTPSTASTYNYVLSLNSHAYKCTHECSFSYWYASLHYRPPSASSPYEQTPKSGSHIPTLGSQLTVELSLSTRPTFDWPPPTTCQIWFNHGLHSICPHSLNYCFHVRTIMALKCISNLAWSQPWSVSPKLLNYSLLLCMIMASKWLCKLAWSWSWSASLSSPDDSIQV